MNTVDYLIIGQGLAGTSVAQTLQTARRSFILIDEQRPNQASRVASGIWNPISFKRLSKVWLADELIPPALAFYAQSERLFSTAICTNQRMHRIFTSPQEKANWITRCAHPSVTHLMDSDIQPEQAFNVIAPEGLGRVLQSGRVDTVAWLDAARAYFLNTNRLREEAFSFDKLILCDEGIRYKEIQAKGIIFCEGMYAASQNPYFNHLPFRLTKGEVLTVHCPKLNLSEIVSCDVFVLPLGRDVYTIGATYDWNSIDFEPTVKAREELITKAMKFIQRPLDVVTHSVGIRPTVLDRYPLIGTHPQHKQLHIFNGMGSRGVLMAPWLAAEFVRYLQTGSELPREANIARFA